MSWWSDGEPFDEFDPPYCENCEGGDSYEECQRCVKWHERLRTEDNDNYEL